MSLMRREILIADKAPRAIGPYSLGVRTRGLVFTAEILGIDPDTGDLKPGGIEAETRQALINLANVLQSGGSSLDLVVKTTVFMQDLGEFDKMNAVYGEFFKDDPPARSTIQVAALPKSAAVGIEAVAVVAEVYGD
ncbi:MAG: RidA family protein [Anaerolineaceae bacterium]|nr:MAG: RidA family protein [Anaerolineaceae bacterium]